VLEQSYNLIPKILYSNFIALYPNTVGCLASCLEYFNKWAYVYVSKTQQNHSSYVLEQSYNLILKILYSNFIALYPNTGWNLWNELQRLSSSSYAAFC
jgi:hypothetical protein